ncbi:MAG: hypothetical protein ABR531_03775 [Bacteroidales bacterium]
MKKILIISTSLLLLLAGCSQEPANPVVGAWDLIYAKQVSNDTTTATFPGTYQGNQVKMWSDNYWMFVGKFKQDTITEEGFGGGSYTLEGIVYKETIKYHSSDDIVGETLRMRIVVKNDTLIQVWPADEKGEVNKSNYTSERYVRVK